MRCENYDDCGINMYSIILLVYILLVDSFNSESIFEERVNATINVGILDKLKDFNMTYYCKFQANTNVCIGNRSSRRYFYDIRHQTCRQFEYGGCNHSYNMFDSKVLCLKSCRDVAFERVSDNVTANVYCQYQQDFGDCDSYYPSFYFDIPTRKCRGFSYSGCGGNRNRFASQIVCEDICESVTSPKVIGG